MPFHWRVSGTPVPLPGAFLCAKESWPLGEWKRTQGARLSRGFRREHSCHRGARKVLDSGAWPSTRSCPKNRKGPGWLLYVLCTHDYSSATIVHFFFVLRCSGLRSFLVMPHAPSLAAHPNFRETNLILDKLDLSWKRCEHDLDRS